MPSEEPTTIALIAAHNEADRIGATIAALERSIPGVQVWVADDASRDPTPDVVLAAGARLVRRGRSHGKGGNMTAAAEAILSDAEGTAATVLLCDADLGESAAQLTALVRAIDGGECDLAVASFKVRAGGGFGIALRFSRWAIERRCGFRAAAPISGQRALRVETLRALLPFAAGYGMETGMTIDAVRAGLRVSEIELDLSHRATGRTLGGFAHRGRQLADFVRVYLARG